MAEVEVKPGQIWADNDKRGYGRRVRVVEFVERFGMRYALVELVTGRGTGYDAAKPGRRTHIRLDRFRPTSTGYRLVEDVPAVPEDGTGDDGAPVADGSGMATAKVGLIWVDGPKIVGEDPDGR